MTALAWQRLIPAPSAWGVRRGFLTFATMAPLARQRLEGQVLNDNGGRVPRSCGLSG